MDLVEFRDRLEEILSDIAPDFEVYLATSGEVMIATGLMEEETGELVAADFEDEEEIDTEFEPLEEMEEDE